MNGLPPNKTRRGPPPAGVTLVELTVSLVILSVGILGLLGTFRYLATGTQVAREQSLSNNLAQEQIEVLKAKSYYSLLVTTSTTNDTRFTPAISYDDSAYPAETLIEGGVTFTRATRIDSVIQSGATLTVVPWTSDDTGLKQITVYVIWRSRGQWKQRRLQNLAGNLSASPLDARISGTVTRAGAGTPVAGARVQAVENPNFSATADNAGAYSFAVTAGSYTLTCSSTAYFLGMTPANQFAASGANKIVNFVLNPMASFAVTSDLYVRDHVVISQVVASTGPAGEQEYIELYNPTPYPVNMGKGVPGVGTYGADVSSYFYYFEDSGDWRFSWLTYISTYIPPHGFYLIANSPTVSAGGVTRAADATYTDGFSWDDGVATNFSAPNHMLDINENGYIFIVVKVDGAWWVQDRLGWCKGGNNPWNFETACRASALGIQSAEQFVRLSSPAATSSVYGPAYDSDNNSLDFVEINPLTVAPRNSAVTMAPLTGSPAFGGWAGLSDPLSQTMPCVNTVLGTGHRVCRYTTNAATGAWTAVGFASGLIAPKNYFLEVGNIAVAAATVFPNAATTPAWVSSPHNFMILQTTTAYAYFAGTVYNAFGTPLNGITVSGSGGSSMVTGADGRYFVAGESGASEITANPGNAVSTYSSEALTLATTPGLLYDPNNFNLSQAGGAYGFFQTTSLQPLPGRVAVALQGGMEEAQASSDNTGRFYFRNLNVGNYTVAPSLDTAESVSPSTASLNVAVAGTTVFIATFTVSNGLARIRGLASKGGQAINTGALVIATTATLAGGAATPPPNLTGTSGCSPCYYGSSSDPLGNYVLNVRSSATSYNVYGWFTTFSGNTPTTTRIGPFAVAAANASTDYTVNLPW